MEDRWVEFFVRRRVRSRRQLTLNRGGQREYTCDWAKKTLGIYRFQTRLRQTYSCGSCAPQGADGLPTRESRYLWSKDSASSIWDCGKCFSRTLLIRKKKPLTAIQAKVKSERSCSLKPPPISEWLPVNQHYKIEILSTYRGRHSTNMNSYLFQYLILSFAFIRLVELVTVLQGVRAW